MSLPKLPTIPRATRLGGRAGFLALLGSLVFFGILYQLSGLAPGNAAEQAELSTAITATYVVGALITTRLLGRLGIRRAAVIASLAGAAIDGVAAVTPWPGLRLALVTCAALTAVVPTYSLMYAGQRAEAAGAEEDVTEATMGVATAAWNLPLAGAPLLIAAFASAFGLSAMLVSVLGIELVAAALSWMWIGADAHAPGPITGTVLQAQVLRRVVLLALAIGFGAGTVQTAGLIQAGAIGVPTKWFALTSVAGLAGLPAGRWAKRTARGTWVAVFVVAGASFALGALDPHLPGHTAKIVALFATYAGVMTAVAVAFAATLSVGRASDAGVRATEGPIRSAASFIGMVLALPMAFLMLAGGFTLVCTICAVGFAAVAVLVVSYGPHGFDRTDTQPGSLATPAPSHTIELIYRHHRETQDRLQRIGELNDALLAHTGTWHSHGGETFDSEQVIAELHRLVGELEDMPETAREAYARGEAVSGQVRPLVTEWLARHGRNRRNPVLRDARCQVELSKTGFTVRVEPHHAQRPARAVLELLRGDLELTFDEFPEPLVITVAQPPRVGNTRAMLRLLRRVPIRTPL